MAVSGHRYVRVLSIKIISVHDPSYSMPALITFDKRSNTVHAREQPVVDVVMVICTFCKLLYPESTHLDTFRI